MDRCPGYVKPIVEYQSTLVPELFPAARRLFAEKKYEESFRTLLRHANPDLAERCEKEPGHWVIPHGSLVVEIRLTPDGRFEIEAPFVKLPAERRAPLLRQAVELNTFTLRLPELVLEEDRLTFRYSAPLATCDPSKLYGVLYEICINGDCYDDEYVSKFGAQPLREKEVTPLPAEQVELAWQATQEILAEAKRFSDHYSAKRWHGFNFEIQGIALMRVDHAVAPQGYLRTRLERSIGHLFEERSPEEIAGMLTRELDEYRTLERAAFERDLYRASFFISAKRAAEVQACQKDMARRWQFAQEDRAHQNHEGVGICYLFAAYHLLYSFFPSAALRAELVETLSAMGGKGWEEAGELAWASFQKIMSPAYC